MVTALGGAAELPLLASTFDLTTQELLYTKIANTGVLVFECHKAVNVRLFPNIMIIL